MSTDRTTNDDLRRLIDRNHDDSTRQFAALDNRVAKLERREPGHSDAEIVQMIDDRLQAIMPSIIEGAVGHALETPLKRVDESIEASKQNRQAIRQVQEDLRPLVEIRDGIVFLRRAVVVLGSIASAIIAVWSIAGGALS